MTTEQFTPPSLEKVKERAAQMQKLNDRFDALIAIADYMIAELETDMRKQPLYRRRLDTAMKLLDIESEKFNIK